LPGAWPERKSRREPAFFIEAAGYLVVVVVVVELAVPAGVSTVVDFVVSVDVLGVGDTFTVVLEGVLSAGFSFTTVVVEDVDPVDPDGVTSALQPARVTATSAARA
jgi:hypothetical protein